MKKIFAIIVFVFAFSLEANAQDKNFKKVDEKIEAQKNIESLNSVLKLNSKMQADLLGLFEYKYRALNENLSLERKTELAKIIEMKLRATLTSSEIDVLDKKGLLKTLSN